MACALTFARKCSSAGIAAHCARRSTHGFVCSRPERGVVALSHRGTSGSGLVRLGRPACLQWRRRRVRTL